MSSRSEQPRSPARVAIALAAVLAANPALAADLTAAKEAAARAERAIAGEQWCAATGQFFEAYRLSEEPRALFNAAVAAQKGGHLALARSAFERFAAVAAGTPLAPKARERLEAIAAQLAAGERNRPCDAGPVPELVAAAAPPPSAPVAETPAPAAPASAVEPPVTREQPTSRLLVAGWVTLGAGVVALAAGAGFTASAAGTRSELESAAGADPLLRYDAATRDRIDSFETANTLGTVGIVSGLILAAGGGALLWLDSRESE